MASQRLIQNPVGFFFVFFFSENIWGHHHLVSHTSPALLISPSSDFADVLSLNIADLNSFGIKYLCSCVCVHAYVFVYLLQTEYQYTYSTSKKDFFGEGRTFLVGPHNFKGLFDNLLRFKQVDFLNVRNTRQDDTRTAKIFVIVSLLQ